MDEEVESLVKRRVYELPLELVERIVEFQKEKGLSSEVEAARRLLDQALKSRDTLESLIGRYLAKLNTEPEAADAARDVLVGHPLVNAIHFEEYGVKFCFQRPNRPESWILAKSPDEIISMENPHQSYGDALRYIAKNPVGHRLTAKSSDLDDEIPF